MTIVVVILGLLNLALLAVLLLRRPSSNDTAAQMLKQDITQMNETVTKLREGLQDKLTERLDKNQQMMLGSLHKQFSESSKLIAEVTRNLTELKESNKQVVGITDELKTLQNVLTNPKQRGVLGEYYLATVLQNVLPPERFTLQYKFKDGEVVDAIVYLDGRKFLPVDSKFSLENYNRIIEEKDKARREQLEKLFKADLNLRIDETSKYIRPNEGTMDFAFMFIPSEAIYYDLLINKIGATNTSARDLIEYAFRDKHVIIVSPTSFMAYLQTVLQGLRSLQIEEQAKEIQIRVGQLGRHLTTYEQFMQRLGNSLGTTVNHYNNAHKELKKVDKDIVKIAGESANIEPLALEKPATED